MKIRSVKTKLLLLFIPVSVVLLVVAAIIIGSIARNVTFALAQSSAEETLNATVRIVEEWLEGLKSTMHTLGLTEEIQSIDRGRYTPLLVSLKKEAGGLFELVFFVDPSGKAMTDGGEIYDLNDRDYFREVIHKGKPYAVSNAVVSKQSNNPVFTVVVQTKDPKGKVIGAVGATVTLKALSEKVSSIRLGKEGYTFLTDGTGLIIAHPEAKFVMDLNLLESAKVGYKGLEEVGRELLSGKSGLRKMTKPSGSKEIALYEPVGGTMNWGLTRLSPKGSRREEHISIDHRARSLCDHRWGDGAHLVTHRNPHIEAVERVGQASRYLREGRLDRFFRGERERRDRADGASARYDGQGAEGFSRIDSERF